MNEHDLVQALEGHAAAVDPAGPPTSAMIARAASVRKRRTAVGVVAVAAVVAVIATTVSLLGVGGDTSSAPEVISPGGGRGGFAEALAMLPADTSSVRFDDQAAAAERIGLRASTAPDYATALSDFILTTS
ncbi:hypothetical protein BH11ACT8_BH11ACT8_33570 [soil metagenome]